MKPLYNLGVLGFLSKAPLGPLYEGSFKAFFEAFEAKESGRGRKAGNVKV